MTTIPQLPTASSVGLGDLVPLSQNGALFAASVDQITAGLQTEILLPTGDLLGRTSAGAGEPEALAVGSGLALSSATLVATAGDHLELPLLAGFDAADEVIVNAAGAPSRMPIAELRGLFTAGAGIALDPNGTLSVTETGIAGPAGPQGPAGSTGLQGVAGPPGPQGSGLVAPGAANSASAIGGGDYVAIWQNGSNAWITYQQLIGGQTIDQLPAAGPASDSDQLLVAQGGNALSSQSFAAIWSYVAQKLSAVRAGVVELTADTVLDATTHNRRILAASQPIVLSANFANMGSGFSCRLINLSAGAVTLGLGIVSGTGNSTLPPGASTEITALTFSGGSIVWWDGVAPASPTITVNAVAAPAPGVPFVVSGGLFDISAAALDYSTDGAQWISAANATIGASSYSFDIPGLAAGTYSVLVRDHATPSIFGRSPAFTVAAATVRFSNVPSSVSGGGSIVVAGTVSPSGTAVQVGLSASNSIAPTGFSAATVTGSTWTASLAAGSAAGTAYVWAEFVGNAGVQAISNAIAITAPTASIAYTVNQPSVTTVAAGSGTLPLNGGISPPQATATQVAFSTSNSVAPGSGWQSASIIQNNSVWAMYATVPATAATYYIWVETAAGTDATVSTFSLSVT